MKKAVIEPMDLRGIADRSGGALLHISLAESRRGERVESWILAGAAFLDGEKGRTHLRAYVGRGATDAEHDASLLLALDLVGLVFEGHYGGASHFSAYIDPDRIDAARIPMPDYDPFESGEMCDGKWCGGRPHPLAPYLPPSGPDVPGSEEMLRAVAGRRIEFAIGHDVPDTDEDAPAATRVAAESERDAEARALDDFARELSALVGEPYKRPSVSMASVRRAFESWKSRALAAEPFAEAWKEATAEDCERAARGLAGFEARADGVAGSDTGSRLNVAGRLDRIAAIKRGERRKDGE